MAPSADAGSPYHPGELEVQAQAGVPEAARRVGQIIRPEIPPTAAAFLAAQPLVVAGSVGSDGSVWASLLTGPPGFAAARSERAIQIAPFDTHDDRFLERVAATGTIALLAIEPATRRRVRLNGRAVVASDGSIAVTTEQVYANCPKYIQAREQVAAATGVRPPRRAAVLTAARRRAIGRADTLFLASHHPAAGTDVSHRGGTPGFVRTLDERRLLLPDYAGNNMFNTLGNIAANPRVGLLIVDFDGGGTLQLSGRAEIVWDRAGFADLPGAERAVAVTIDAVVAVADGIAGRWRFLDASRFNPPAATAAAGDA